MNYTIIAGHLGADPEVRFTSSGQKVTTLRVACRARKDKTIWWKVTLWGDQFDKMIQFFKKGSPIIVMGELMEPEIFKDRDGNPQISLQITANNIAFSPFGKPKSNEESNQSSNQFANSAKENSFGSNFSNDFEEVANGSAIDEDIPF